LFSGLCVRPDPPGRALAAVASFHRFTEDNAAQSVEVAAILVPGRDRHHACRRHGGERVRDEMRIARIRQPRRDDTRKAQQVLA
jgi:hypothetical protein